MTRARAGTAYADEPDAHAGGLAAAAEALQRTGGGIPTLAICFHHGRLDPDAVRAGVTEALGPGVPLIGGSAMGVITNDALGYEGHQVGVAVVTDAPAGLRVVAAAGLAVDGEGAVGAALGAQLAPQEDRFIVYSSVRSGLSDEGGLSLWFGTPLLDGLEQRAGRARSTAGAGLIDSIRPNGSHVFAPEGTLRDGAAALAVGEPLRLDAAVLHGCRPAGAYHEITRAAGPAVLEIDGRPALDVVDELMGPGANHEEYPFNVILGVNHGDRFGAFDPDLYQTRLCLAVDPELRALIMFEPDLEAGAKVQLMRISYDLDYVDRKVRALVDGIGDRRPLLAIYADCAGRCRAISPLDEEEGDAVRAAVGEIPLLGFYSGVEIGPVGDEVRPLDWTGVLCLLSSD